MIWIGIFIFCYAVYMCIGMFWSMVLMGKIAFQFTTKRRMLICFLLNFLLWPIGMIHRYHKRKRMWEGEGRIVF